MTDSTSVKPVDNGKLVTESGLIAVEEQSMKESPIISENNMHNAADEHCWLSFP